MSGKAQPAVRLHVRKSNVVVLIPSVQLVLFRGFFTQGETVVCSAPQRAYYHADVIYLLP